MNLQKKSFTIGNHRTSISLEPEFWNVLELKANEQDVSLSKLVLKIDNEKPKDYNNLASYIRIWVLKKIGWLISFGNVLNCSNYVY